MDTKKIAPIVWLDDNACLIDGKVWVTVVDPRLTVGLGHEMCRAVFGTEEEYLKSKEDGHKQGS